MSIVEKERRKRKERNRMIIHKSLIIPSPWGTQHSLTFLCKYSRRCFLQDHEIQKVVFSAVCPKPGPFEGSCLGSCVDLASHLTFRGCLYSPAIWWAAGMVWSAPPGIPDLPHANRMAAQGAPAPGHHPELWQRQGERPHPPVAPPTAIVWVSHSPPLFFTATPAAYGCSCVRSRTEPAASGLCHSHTNYKPHLRPALQLVAMPDPWLTERGLGLNLYPHGHMSDS